MNYSVTLLSTLLRFNTNKLQSSHTEQLKREISVLYNFTHHLLSDEWGLKTNNCPLAGCHFTDSVSIVRIPHVNLWLWYRARASGGQKGGGDATTRTFFSMELVF